MENAQGNFSKILQPAIFIRIFLMVDFEEFMKIFVENFFTALDAIFSYQLKIDFRRSCVFKYSIRFLKNEISNEFLNEISPLLLKFTSRYFRTFCVTVI